MTVTIPVMSSSSLPIVEPCDHEIAPNGDTVLLLKNPNAPFAVWRDSAASKSASEPASPKDESSSSASSIKFLVSSHHLKSASSVFRAALAGPWLESTWAKDGRHQITAEDWDVEALLVVLNVVHGRNNLVPKTVTLELLCKISVLVDYYHLSEAVLFPRLLWVDGLRASVPKTYGRELILWLCVSWVFQDDASFRAVTETAIRESSETVSALQLPISAAVIDKINEQRNLILITIILFLEGLKTSLINGTIGCTSTCQTIMLGVLTKVIGAYGILERWGCYYSNGMSVSKAVRAVKAIEPLDIEWHPKGGSWHKCVSSLSEDVSDFVGHHINEVEPLELDKFNSIAG